uniref:Parietopsin n=1 Tax=Neogobius melanostomus TaxID=47308 RepID=A0A8C6ULK8_9GOBI
HENFFFPIEALVTVTPTIFPRFGYSILSFLMFITTVLTVFNNTTVIVVMVRNSLLQPMNVFILSLAVSDLMIGLCGSLVVTITNYRGYYFIGRASYCPQTALPLGCCAGLVSLCTLTLLAYERYHVVCKPRAGMKLSMRRSMMGLLFVWVFCLFWAITPLFGWSGYGPEGRSWSNYSYLILYTLLCFLLPVAIIIYCYYKVLTCMNKLNRSVELQGGRPSQQENEHAITMVLSMIVAFFICWLPYTVMSVVVVVNPELYIPPLLATMPMYFAKTSPVYNPIIYFLSNKQVRSYDLMNLPLFLGMIFLLCPSFATPLWNAVLRKVHPHGPAASNIRMLPLNNREARPPRTRNIHSKVLPL